MKNKKIILLMLSIIPLFADTISCHEYMNKTTNLSLNVEQFARAKQITKAKEKANLFQISLINTRTECTHLAFDYQKEINIAIEKLNADEKIYVKSGLLKASSL